MSKTKKRKLNEEAQALTERLEIIRQKSDALHSDYQTLTTAYSKALESGSEATSYLKEELVVIAAQIELTDKEYSNTLAAIQTCGLSDKVSFDKKVAVGTLALTGGLGVAGLVLGHRTDVRGNLINKTDLSFFKDAWARLFRK